MRRLGFYGLIIVFFICHPYICYSILPEVSYKNICIDFENIYTYGARPVSGSIIDYMDMQGAIRITDEEHDYAIIGSGFFLVTDSITGEKYYTRNGRFNSIQGEVKTIGNDKVEMNLYGLNNTKKKQLAVELYYPENIYDVDIVDCFKIRIAGKVKKVKGLIIKGAIEENPIDLLSLIDRTEICLKADYDEKVENELKKVKAALKKRNESNTDNRAHEMVNLIGLIHAIKEKG
ncbi:MAG: flagellar basal body rod protein FlgG [Smithella sp. PtaU1.Bin162]|nr:MAG: flagellar basal body rod protein FlgG [Smithella sp. PtaU1.Bin162]